MNRKQKKEQERKRKMIITAGRRSGKSIWSALSIAKEYLPKEEYEKFAAELQATLRSEIDKMIEEDGTAEWVSADQLFMGELGK